MPEERQRRVQKALFRGAQLTLENPAYRRVLRSLLDALLVPDLAPRDLTVAALGIKSRAAAAHVLAREPGVAAGLEEYAYLLRQRGVRVTLKKEDGDVFQTGDVLLRAEGGENKLLSLERVGLNLLQRMCGIATATQRLQEPRAASAPPRELPVRGKRRGACWTSAPYTWGRSDAPVGAGRRHRSEK